MDTSMVAVATMTWVRSDREEAALRASIECLATTGLPIAVADRGARANFTSFLQGCSSIDVVVPHEAGLVPQVKATFTRANDFDTPFILYTEPDKRWFFEHALMTFIHEAPADDGIGVVMPSRSVESFLTFPPMQRYAEGVVNYLCSECLGNQGDYFYGPFLVHRTLLPAIAQAPADLGWGWRPFVFRKAHRQGLRLVHLPGTYPCPADQRDEDDTERTHRLRQLSENVRGLIA